MKESEHPSTLETPSPSTSRTATVKETLFLPSHPYLSRKVDVVDDVDCWKIGWALVDATRHSTYFKHILLFKKTKG